MSISSDFYEDVERPRGGKWVQFNDFKEKGQKIEGTLVSIEVRPRINPKNGEVIRGQKSGKPRRVYRVTFEVPADKRDGTDDDGLRIWDANEAGQIAIRDAYKAVGTKELIGGRFAAVIVAAAEDDYSQATYKAKFEAAPKTATVELDDTDDLEPF